MSASQSLRTSSRGLFGRGADRFEHDPDGPFSSYEPVGVQALAGPPQALVDADRTKSWWRRVLPLVLARRWAFILSLLGALAAMVIGVVIPTVTKQAIDSALISQTRPIAPYAIALLALGLGRAVITYYYRTTLYGIAYRLEYDLRTILYGHFTRLSFSFFDRVQSGQLISRANSDIRSVQMFLTFAPLIVLNMLSFVLALVFMLRIHVGLTLVALCVMPFVYVFGVRLRNLLFPLSWVVQARLADIATIVDENVNGVRVVRSFAAEQRQLEALAAASIRERWSAIAQIDARARYGPIVENLPRLGLALVLMYGGILVVDGKVTIGALVAFNAYVLLLQAPFRTLGFILILGQRASASAQRIYEVLDEPVEVVERPGAVDLVDPRGEIEFRDVVFGYDTTDVLKGFNLRVEPGETVAIVGRTGSGKSTIARLLPRFYDVRAGSVSIDGHDVRDLTLASLRHHIGVVLDEPFLFSASIRDNIAYAAPQAALDDVRRAARAAQAEGFILELPQGYDAIIGERGYDLSGGQRQRIAIARTLLANPRVLVLDDSTSAIDVRVEERIHEALRRLMTERTTIVIAHRLSTIALADRVVLIEDGHVVAEGRHSDLLQHEPRYAAVLARLEAEDAESDGESVAALSAEERDGDSTVAVPGGGA